MFKIEGLNPCCLSFKWKNSYKCFCVTAVIGAKFFPNGIAIHWLLGQVPDIIDNAYVIVEFDNGSRGMLDLCMFAEGSKNEQEISVVGDIGKGEAFVPESVVRFGTREGRNDIQTMKAKDQRIKYAGLHHGSSYLEHLNFLSAIRGKGEKAPSVDLQDGLVSVAMGVAAQLSIEYGRFVSIDEVMNELRV
ncbi:hypothetical protein ACSQ67_007371 [Phaseolus vulgaris]